MRCLLLVLLVSAQQILSAQEQGRVITKSITIINGDTIINQETTDLPDGVWDTGESGFLDMDGLPDFRTNDLDSALRAGLADLTLRMESIDLDSILLDIDVTLGSILQDLDRGVRSFDFGDLGIRSEVQPHNTVADRIEAALNRDGLLPPGPDHEVQLTGKHLLINGDKQAANVFFKYKQMWEAHSGILLSRKDRITMTLSGEDYTRSVRRD